MLYPCKFTPIFVERVWGGTGLAHFGKSLPAGKRIGESWEISDRPEAQSILSNGPDRGQTLAQLVATHGRDLLGANTLSAQYSNTPTLQHSKSARFPLLIKLLDARERLSLQVHPPAALAAKLGGEPKTEMWYVLDAAPDAHLIAGLRRGVTREQFTAALTTHHPPLADLIYRFPVAPADGFFVPSGRLHAIDAGVVLVEIQQNSDTTYRVYDWDRLGLDGKPRALHVAQSLACINFDDFEPAKLGPRVETRDGNRLSRLIECPEFAVHKLLLHDPWIDVCDGTTFHIVAGVAGELAVRTATHPEERLAVGQFILLPAALGPYTLVPLTPTATALKTFVPPPRPT